MVHVAQGLAVRGISVITFDFPYMAAKRRAPDPGAVLERAFAERWQAVTTDPPQSLRPRGWFAGGKSMGGRIASQAASRGMLIPNPHGLVFFGYPLHPPGKPSQKRDGHLPGTAVPLLFLHGTRDPFGSPDEMHELTGRLDRATLTLVENGDHSLVAPKRTDPTGTSVEHALDVAAEWMSHIIG
jgi:predicted alpha/beta-hydrolase family hydrolase